MCIIDRDKLATGTGAFVDGVGKIGSATNQLADGLTSLSTAEKTAAKNASQATKDFGTLQSALTAVSQDQKACADGDTGACDELADDQAAMGSAMKALGTSVYTTSGYLNGADAKHPGLAAGLTKVASGAHKLADGVTTAAAKRCV